MAGSSFGVAFRITTAGESHGPANVVVIDGCPPGIKLTPELLQVDLDRRRPGQSHIVTQRQEQDTAEILAGVFEGRTTGTSVAILVRNTDARSKDYSDIADLYRPGHADYTFDAKYGFRDYRGGGRSSARETVARVAAGVLAKQLLAEHLGASIVGYVKQVGEIVAEIPDPTAVTLEQVERLPGGEPNIVRCPDPAAALAMVRLIEQVRKEQDSIGGVAEIVAQGLPPGLGEPVFDKLKADLGKALFSLPAVLGVEYGSGFACAKMRGSQHNDPFELAAPLEGSPKTVSNSGFWTKSENDDSGPGVNIPTALAAGAAAGAEGQTVLPQALRAEVSQATVRLSGSSLTGTPIGPDAAGVPELRTTKNDHGGMLGGISSGMPIILRAAVKPTSSLPRPQQTVTRRGEPATVRTKGRHDPCLLPRFIPMAEAMVAICLADHYLRQRALR